MKKTGICTKCGARDLKTGLRGNHSAIMITWFKGVTTQACICRRCGYVEEYVLQKHMGRLQ